MVFRKAPVLYEQSVLDGIHATESVLNAYLRWMNDEDTIYESLLDHFAGQPGAPKSLDQNPKQAEAMTSVIRQSERLSLVLNNFRRGESAPALDAIPSFPEHTEPWG